MEHRSSLSLSSKPCSTNFGASFMNFLDVIIKTARNMKPLSFGRHNTPLVPNMHIICFDDHLDWLYGPCSMQRLIWNPPRLENSIICILGAFSRSTFVFYFWTSAIKEMVRIILFMMFFGLFFFFLVGARVRVHVVLVMFYSLGDEMVL